MAGKETLAINTKLEQSSATAEELRTSLSMEEEQVYEELIDELKKLDLGTNEARILVYMMTHGASTASDISRYTKIQRTDTYRYLSQLLAKGVAVTTFSKPQKYSSLSFDDVVDHLVQSKYEMLKGVLQTKRDCQDKLDRISKITSEFEDMEANQYQILSAESIMTRLKRSISTAEQEVDAFFTQKMLSTLYHSEITDDLLKLTQNKVSVRLKMPETQSKIDLGEAGSKLLALNIAAPIPLNFVIFDEKEMLIIIEAKDPKNLSGFYTNNEAMIGTFLYLFERMT
jgi:sugar-specific transcriptional regulator TrmB